MTVRFKLNGRAVLVEASPAARLSDVLRDDLGLTGTHVGCEHGVCGACRCKVLSGRVDHGSIPPVGLGPAEREAGYALLCCARAQSDVAIEARELRSSGEIPVKTLPARVEKMTRAAPDVMLLELKLPAGAMGPGSPAMTLTGASALAILTPVSKQANSATAAMTSRTP